jgi:hypothetical protein
MRFAAKYPRLVKSLSVVSSSTPLRKSLGQQIPAWQKLIKAKGVRSWASSTMSGRLGSDSPPEATAWWTELMGSAHTSTVVGIMRNLIEVAHPRAKVLPFVFYEAFLPRHAHGDEKKFGAARRRQDRR